MLCQVLVAAPVVAVVDSVVPVVDPVARVVFVEVPVVRAGIDRPRTWAALGTGPRRIARPCTGLTDGPWAASARFASSQWAFWP